MFTYMNSFGLECNIYSVFIVFGRNFCMLSMWWFNFTLGTIWYFDPRTMTLGTLIREFNLGPV